jgi:hypothetical protein
MVAESGTYEDQLRRSYTTQLTGDVEQIITERFRRTKGIPDTGALIGDVAGSFLVPESQGHEIAIPNGWGGSRFRMLLEVEAVHQSQMVAKAVIMAWSENNDMSYTGQIDPDMPFYINNIEVLRTWTQKVSGVGNVQMTGVAEASQLLANNRFSGAASPNREHHTRPQDVFSFMSRSAMDLESPDSNTYDARTVATNVPVKSQARNNVAASYVSKMLGGYVQAHRTAGATGGTGFDIMMEAQSLVQETEAGQDFFLRAIRDLRREPMIRNYFTLSELSMLSPNLEHVFQHIPRMQLGRLNERGEGEPWFEICDESLIATILKDAVPGLMMELMFTRAIISANNRSLANGQSIVHMEDYKSFADMDMTNNIFTFEQRMLTEIIPGIANWNGITNSLDYEIDMMVQLDGETRISVSIYGRPRKEYIVPQFADALMSPNMTHDEDSAFHMAHDFSTLGDIVTDAAMQLPTMQDAVFQGSSNDLGKKKIF